MSASTNDGRPRWIHLQAAVILGGARSGYLYAYAPGARCDELVFPVGRRGVAAQVLAHALDRGCPPILLGSAPRASWRAPGLHEVPETWCLTVELLGPAALERLGRFEPEPHLVVSCGRSATLQAYWSIAAPLDADDAERARRTLAGLLACDDPGSVQPRRLVHVIDGARTVIVTERAGAERPLCGDILGGALRVGGTS